jgi:hypothetical protein
MNKNKDKKDKKCEKTKDKKVTKGEKNKIQEDSDENLIDDYFCNCIIL